MKRAFLIIVITCATGAGFGCEADTSGESSSAIQQRQKKAPRANQETAKPVAATKVVAKVSENPVHPPPPVVVRAQEQVKAKEDPKPSATDRKFAQCMQPIKRSSLTDEFRSHGRSEHQKLMYKYSDVSTRFHACGAILKAYLKLRGGGHDDRFVMTERSAPLWADAKGQRKRIVGDYVQTTYAVLTAEGILEPLLEEIDSGLGKHSLVTNLVEVIEDENLKLDDVQQGLTASTLAKLYISSVRELYNYWESKGAPREGDLDVLIYTLCDAVDEFDSHAAPTHGLTEGQLKKLNCGLVEQGS
ncbi:MAG: hypothetical protein CMI52_02840 [Parcubacteria group bacterium]|nr:hypothetical protein [Parcubacteria group bacterium]